MKKTNDQRPPGLFAELAAYLRGHREPNAWRQNSSGVSLAGLWERYGRARVDSALDATLALQKAKHDAKREAKAAQWVKTFLSR